MRLCPIVNVHVVVETCPLCECLLTLVATVRSLTTVHSLVSPGEINTFYAALFQCVKLSSFDTSEYSPKTRASPKSLSTILANIRSAVRVASLVGHQ